MYAFPRIPLLPTLLLLGACATERDQCLSDASRDLRIVDGLIEQSRANLARGYAIETGQELRERPYYCYRTRPDGTRVARLCEDIDVVRTRRAVAIDLFDERQKLDSLLTERPALRDRAVQRVADCQRLYPPA